MSSSTITFAPHQSSPLARTTSPFKDPRPPPCTPAKTARLWDEYERQAVENAKRRDTTCSNATVLDIIRSYDPHSSPKVPAVGSSPTHSTTASPHFDFGFGFSPRTKARADSAHSTTVAICKTCKQAITSTSGICEQCKKTIVWPLPSGENTPPLSPAARNFASTDLPQLHKNSSGTSTPTSSSPKRKTNRSSSTQLVDPPIRLSSLRPPPSQDSTSGGQSSRSRKASLTDPNEPFLRLQISRKPVPLPRTQPSSPTTPPSTSHSHASTNPRTRPSSLANITTPPNLQYTGACKPSSSRHNSATPSELSTLYPYVSNTATSPPSVCRASYSLQNQTSAWDDWDSEEEEDKVGLVKYWKGRKWRGSRGSLGDASGGGRRDSSVKDERKRDGGREEGKSRRRGFVRVISCGCDDD